jgi:H+-transporting ATPase
VWNWYFPTLLVVILAILNDGTILTISKDNVKPSPTPDSWKLKEVFISSISFGLWLSLSTIVLFAVINNTDGFASTGVENLCVGCMRDHCHDVFQDQYQICAKNSGSVGCGEIDGSVPRSAINNTKAVGEFRKQMIDAYWVDYQAKYKHSKAALFKDLSDIHLNDLEGDVKPSADAAYDQFVYQYTLNVSGGGVAYRGDYNVIDAAQSGAGVEFIGNDHIPVTNEVAFCDYVWSFSNFNKTWTRNYKMIGAGVQRKEGVLRSIVYTQVSISGQALIFVTRTAGANIWFFSDMPSTLLLVAFVFAQVVASAIGWVGFGGYPVDRAAVIGCGGGYTLIAWIWAFVWHVPLDLIKFGVNHLLKNNAYNQKAFSARINAGHPTMSHSVVTNQQRSIRASRTV